MTVRLTGLSKSYDGAVALDDVNLEIEPGEVHALLGPNGAGKSTLIRCLSGAVVADRGTIEIDGRTLAHPTSKRALAAGVAVIYQNLSLIGSLNAVDNVYLGSELRRGPLLRKRRARSRARALLDQLTGEGSIPLDVPVEDLPRSAQQIVEIAKALHRGGVKLLVLDEPTAALTEPEARALIERLRALKRERIHIVYTTHLLNEVFAIADRVTVLRDGAVAMASRPVEQLDLDAVIAAIAGEAVGVGEKRAITLGSPLLEVDEAVGDAFGPLTLRVRAGETLALYGPMGCGRTELLEAVFGARRLHAGSVRIGDRRRAPHGPGGAIAAGAAFVPSERLRRALFGSLPALDNMLMPSFGGLARGGRRRRRHELARFHAAAERVALAPPDPSLRASALSGGNQQKVVLARWLEGLRTIRVLLLDEPTQGIDVGARAEIYALMRAGAAHGGRAIVVSSSDPEEVVAVADRAIVMRHGRIVGELGPGELNERALLNMSNTGEPSDIAVEV